MRIVSSIALLATLSIGVSPYANAAPELPLIRLERSLIPSHLSIESGDSGAKTILKDNYHTLANAIVRGLLVANRTGEIAYADPISYRVQNVVRSLRRGEALDRASKHAGVSYRVVDRLLKLGSCDGDIN